MLIKKRGYFFILDAVLALLVLVIGVFVVTSYYVEAPKPVQVGLLSGDLLAFLANNKIKEINNPYVGIGGELWNQGFITDPENTLLQQIGEFYKKYEDDPTDDSYLDFAEKFIQNVSKNAVPPQFRYEIWMNDVILYPKTPSSGHLTSKDNAKILITSKRLTFGVMDKKTGEIWGPYKAEAFVWER